MHKCLVGFSPHYLVIKLKGKRDEKCKPLLQEIEEKTYLYSFSFTYNSYLFRPKNIFFDGLLTKIDYVNL